MEFMATTDTGCNGSPQNLFPSTGVSIKDALNMPTTLQPDHWYRLNAQIRQVSGGVWGLEVKAVLQDLERAGAPIVASVTSTFDNNTCQPAPPVWYGQPSTRWLVGVLGQTINGTTQSVETIVDDFVGRPKP